MLEVDNIRVGYDGVPALHGVSFKVDRGEIVSIVGSNGAGKSTILRAVSSLLKTEQGSIHFEGTRIDIQSPHDVVKHGIAHVPEGRRLFARQTVMENLILGAYTRKAPKEREEDMEKIFATFPVLKERRDQKAGTLSGGEQQMLAIGRTLASRPKLLMLDEPSLGLAPIVVTQLIQALHVVRSAGVSLLIAEQTLRIPRELCDEVILCRLGRAVAQGIPAVALEPAQLRAAFLGVAT